MTDQTEASAGLEPATSKKRKRNRSKSNDKPRKTRTPKHPPVECPICLDMVPPTHLHTLPTCNCTYCTACLAEAFEVGLTHRRLNFPATCCGRPLDLDSHEKKLHAPLRRAYRHAMEEMASDNPLYCALADCGSFILADSVKDGFGTCGMCHMKTCTTCKLLKKDHLGKFTVCPNHLEDEQLEKLAADRGWRRCPKCFTLVERVSGCDSMRCKCKTEWCYGCGKVSRGIDRCTCHSPLVPVHAEEYHPAFTRFSAEQGRLEESENIVESIEF